MADPSILEMAKELVAAQIQAGILPLEDMQQALVDTHSLLISLKAKENPGIGNTSGQPSGPSHWRTSISRIAITCLECGRTSRQLSRRHLAEHGLTPRSYKDKYGIPQKEVLAAKETTARRRKAVQETRPWELTPMGVASQAKADAAPQRKRTATKDRDDG